MKRIIVHIGTHKSGSTSIQKVLHRSDAALRNNGVLYPRSGRQNGRRALRFGHHELAWAIREKKGWQPEPTWGELVREIEEWDGDRVVISSEDFEACSDRNVDVIAEYLRPYRVDVLVYIRNPLAYLLSSYKQRVKKGRCSDTFRRFVQDNVSKCEYHTLVSRWQTHLPAGAIHVRSFDAVTERDGLERDIADFIGLSFEGIQPFVRSRANVSPADSAIHLARLVNVAEQHVGRSKVARTLCRKMRKRVLRPSPYPRGAARLLHPVTSRELSTEDDARWLRNAISEPMDRFVREFVREADRRYFEI